MKQNLGWIKNIEVLFKNHRLEIIRGNMESTQVQMVVNGTVEVSLSCYHLWVVHINEQKQKVQKITTVTLTSNFLLCLNLMGNY